MVHVAYKSPPCNAAQALAQSRLLALQIFARGSIDLVNILFEQIYTRLAIEICTIYGWPHLL
jgi:hypothetical protein